MNVPLTSRDVPRVAPMDCFCRQLCPPESYYCSPQCAREDAFNALTLGKPHESSKPPMAPLPTLPPGFFKLPPKQNLNEADELMFMSDDHGPFQEAAWPSRKFPRARMPRAPRSVPRSITTTSSSEASTAPPKRSEWRSHYRQTQQLDPTDIPLFLVEKVDCESIGDHELKTTGVSLEIPTASIEPRQQGTDHVRVGSFGIIPASLTGTETNTLMPYDDSHNQHRSSTSSYNSLTTSGTSRFSYTSVTPSLDLPPTKSTHLSQPQPRLGYGSAFGGRDEKPLALDAAKMVADLRDSLLVAKSASRKRSSTDATAKPFQGEQTEQPPVKEQPLPASLLKDISVKKASMAVPKVHWPQYGITTSRSEQRFTSAPQSQAINSPSSYSALGTMVKKTTTASKGRLPIGTPQQVPPRPKTPSNVLPAGINLSLHSRSFCAPAYAMGAPKIPASTRPLRTSLSRKSLRSQKEDARAQNPGMASEELRTQEESFKRSFEPTIVTEARGDSTDADVLMINERDATSSAQTGSRFTLSNAPKPLREMEGPAVPPKDKPESKSFRPTLTVNPPSFDRRLDNTPRLAPSGVNERSPSTAGGPLTPRANTPVGSPRPVWLSPPSEMSTKSNGFMAAIQRTTRRGSNASHPDDDAAHAQVHVAPKMKMQTSPPFLRSAFDWRITQQ